VPGVGNPGGPDPLCWRPLKGAKPQERCRVPEACVMHSDHGAFSGDTLKGIGDL
jgi:hypothetical protein